MMKIVFLFVLVFQSCIIYADEPRYTKFNSLADPLYSPWLCDPEFLFIHERYPEPFGPGRWEAGRYLQYAFSRTALSTLEGDMIECGLQSGKSFDIFASVLDLYDTKGRTIFGFDSFEGLADPDGNDLDVRMGWQFFKRGSCKGWDKATMEQQLAHHKCPIQLVQGWIPKCFQGYEDKRFCFAHIDVDLYQATLDTLAYIYPRMVKNGIILFDDYGFPMCPGARKAVDEYLKGKPEIVIQLPTGQAMLIKH